VVVGEDMGGGGGGEVGIFVCTRASNTHPQNPQNCQAYALAGFTIAVVGAYKRGMGEGLLFVGFFVFLFT
jgi:CTP-dependent riboflavin kinase